MTLLFQKHLEMTSPLLLEQTTDDDDAIDLDQLMDLLRTFAGLIDESQDDLGDLVEAFAEANDLDAEALAAILIEAAKAMYGNGEDEQIKSFLKQLSQPLPQPDTGYASPYGRTSVATKRFLKTLPIAAQSEPYSNRSFDASRYSTFPRQASRYGRDYDYETANESELVFKPVDSLGLGITTNHWRVINTLDNNRYVTDKMSKLEAENTAAELNRDYEELLAEEMRKRNAIPSVELQENIFKSLNPAYERCLQRMAIKDTLAGNAPPLDANDLKQSLLLIEANRKDEGDIDELQAIHNSYGRR